MSEAYRWTRISFLKATRGPVNPVIAGHTGDADRARRSNEGRRSDREETWCVSIVSIVSINSVKGRTNQETAEYRTGLSIQVQELLLQERVRSYTMTSGIMNLVASVDSAEVYARP